MVSVKPLIGLDVEFSCKCPCFLLIWRCKPSIEDLVVAEFGPNPQLVGERYRKVMLYFFDGILVCRNMEYSRNMLVPYYFDGI